MGKSIRYLIVFIPILLSLSLIFSTQINAASSTDDWPVFRHDASHSGFFEGAAPITSVPQLWNHTIDASALSAPGSAVVVGNRVYVGSIDHNFYCFDASTGAVVWSISVGGAVDSSVAVSEGRVYVGADDGYVYCLDASNGAQVWTSSVGEAVDSPVNFADGKVYVESGNGNVFCIDAANGNKVWNYSTGTTALQSCPAVSGGRVFVGNDDGAVFCLDATNGAKIWNFTAGDRVRSPTVAGGYVYFGSKDGNAYCLDASSGLKVWNYTTWFNSAGPARGYFWGNEVSEPAVSYGRVYVGSSDFDVFCLDAATGDKIWNITTGAEVYAAPAVADGCVFVGSYDGNVYCLNASSGAENWRFAAGVYSPVNAGGSAGSPVVADGVVYVVGNGVLSALGSPSTGSSFPLMEVIIAVVVLIVVVVIVALAYVLLRKRKPEAQTTSP